MKILILANSQGTDAGVEPGESYPRLLRELVAPEHEVVDMSRSGWDVRRFVDELDEARAHGADVAFVQVGIVECVQRILSAREKRFFRAVPLGDRFTKFLHDRRPVVVRLRRRLGVATRLYSPAAFRDALAALVRGLEAAGTRVVLLEIPGFPHDHEQRWYPFVNDDVALFNRALAEFGAVPFIDGANPGLWQRDTVHLTRAGHEAAARRLAELL